MKRYPGFDALLPTEEQRALEQRIRRRAEQEEEEAETGPVKERDASTGDRSYLLDVIDSLRSHPAVRVERQVRKYLQIEGGASLKGTP